MSKTIHKDRETGRVIGTVTRSDMVLRRDGTSMEDMAASFYGYLSGMEAVLREQHPEIDFGTVPVQEWWRIYSGKRYVSGFVGGWKAYGRSNAEDPAKREILPDYSGNGRHIRLYNFEFTENSGYSGGGLVSDGVDDYGQCVKGFALPDDYTVVAVRKILNNASCVVGKSVNASQGAFIFETGGGTYSFGANNTNLQKPALFSYQMKTSYNGSIITVGSGQDNENSVLVLFKMRPSVPEASAVVLYDLRIYDHSLTAEELEAVKDEMMSDYEKATGGGIANIHYVADWDGKGRSNDEEEPMRSQWIDKTTGKVIDLNNYAFAGMSGWGGYGTDMSKLVPHDDIAVTETAVTSLKCTSILQQSNSPIAEWGPNRIASGPTAVRFRVTGVSDNLGIRFESYAVGEGLKTLFTATGDGVYTAEISDPAKYYRWIAVTQGTTVYPVNCDITIEQLLLYPGALVSDGVDDYGLTREAISEEVGTMLVYTRLLDESVGGSYILNTNNSPEDNGRLYIWRTGNGNYGLGLPEKNAAKPPFVLTREPVAPASPMYIASSSPGYYSACFIHRIILIREQLDDAQVDFLKWKVDKEYLDWCIENGYEYAINQLTA